MAKAPGIDFVLDTNASQVTKLLVQIAKDQIPVAVAAALTFTARDAVKDLRDQLGRHFEIRSKRVPRGITINRAEKRDWPRPVAEVGHRDEFMAIQVTGGLKRPQRGARHVAIPAAIITRKRTSTGKIPKPKKPRALRERKTTSVVEDERIIAKVGRKKTSPRLTHYLLRTEARIPKRWPMKEEAIASARKNYPGHFEKTFLQAFKSRRVRKIRMSTAQGRAFWVKAGRAIGSL